MGMPVKLSDDLVRAARAEAEVNDRSITAQIEHWAKLGHAAQKALSRADLLTLEACTGALADGAPWPEGARLARMREQLLTIARSTDRASVLADIRGSGQPLYEAHPEEPGLVLRVEADGSRTRGLVEDGQFRPLAPRLVPPGAQ